MTKHNFKKGFPFVAQKESLKCSPITYVFLFLIVLFMTRKVLEFRLRQKIKLQYSSVL